MDQAKIIDPPKLETKDLTKIKNRPNLPNGQKYGSRRKLFNQTELSDQENLFAPRDWKSTELFNREKIITWEQKNSINQNSINQHNLNKIFWLETDGKDGELKVRKFLYIFTTNFSPPLSVTKCLPQKIYRSRSSWPRKITIPLQRVDRLAVVKHN